MTLLNQIIDDAAKDEPSTSSILRKVLIVARRVEASAIEQWARGELDGFDSVDNLPKYRSKLTVPVFAQYSGPMGASLEQVVGPGSIPVEAREVLFSFSVTQSVDELEQLTEAKGEDTPDSAIPWDPSHVVAFNKFAERGLAPRVQYMQIIGARRIFTRGMIRGILGTVRTTALDLALELQQTDPSAGTQNGPTVADSAIASTVFNVTNNIYGHGANVAQGTSITQSSSVAAGDLAALLRAVEDAGLTDAEAARELAAAAVSPPAEQRNKFEKFLDRVRSGTWLLATGVTTDVATDVIDAAIKGYLGIN